MNDDQLRQVADDIKTRDRADHILHWDKRQGRDVEDTQVCQYDKKHGRLQIHGSGHMLVCAAGRGNDRCQFTTPVSR